MGDLDNYEEIQLLKANKENRYRAEILEQELEAAQDSLSRLLNALRNHPSPIMTSRDAYLLIGDTHVPADLIVQVNRILTELPLAQSKGGYSQERVNRLGLL